MIIETTININIGILDMLNGMSEKCGISRTEMIVFLLKKVMNENTNRVSINNSVKYQEGSSNSAWHKFHIRLKDDEYEYFLDLRKLLKMSVSLILAYAVREYMDGLISGEITDNYPFANYIIAKEVIGNVVCWRFFWGIPPDIEKILSF
ncbi:hypothetical protein ACFL20_00385 [Spirochaetota bacterium]